MVNTSTGSSVDQSTGRIHALDGLRGLMALMVLVAHFFGEVAGGFRGLAFGWVAVIMFFALSGFVVGRQILGDGHRPGMLKGFLVRRLFRTMPAYLVVIVAVVALMAVFEGAVWLEGRNVLPVVSYLTFTQNFAMVSLADPGARWLVPTWTLTVEQQFYILAPMLLLMAPRRYLFAGLLVGAGLSPIYRMLVLASPDTPSIASLVLLPASTDALLLGLAGAVAIREDRLQGHVWMMVLRATAPAALFVACALRLIDGSQGFLFAIWAPTLVAAGCAAFLLSIVRGAPEADRLLAPWLRFTGRISYCLYLTHLIVLGLMHGLLLQSQPDVASPIQLVVTLFAVPVAYAVGWLLTIAVEQPMVSLGRRLTERSRAAPATRQPAIA